MPWGWGIFCGWDTEPITHRNPSKGPKRNKAKAKAQRKARRARR